MLLLCKVLATCIWGFCPSSGLAKDIDIQIEPAGNESHYVYEDQEQTWV